MSDTSITLYLSIDQEKDLCPIIDSQLPDLVEFLNTSVDDEVQNEDNNQYGFGRRRRDQPSKLEKFHKSDQLWLSVMSYSHNVARDRSGNSSVHVGEWTTTKFQDKFSPILSGICLKGEIIRHGILRVASYEDHKLTISEYHMEYLTITNVSVSGGSGGRPVETISLKPKIFKYQWFVADATTGDKIKEQEGFSSWDTVEQKGTRMFLNDSVQSLGEIAKQAIMQKQLSPKEKKDLESLDLVSPYEFNNDREIVVFVTADEKGGRVKRMKTRVSTRVGLMEAASTKLGRESSEVKGIFLVRNKCLEEIEDDSLIADLEGATVYLEF